MPTSYGGTVEVVDTRALIESARHTLLNVQGFTEQVDGSFVNARGTRAVITDQPGMSRGELRAALGLPDDGIETGPTTMVIQYCLLQA